MRIIHRTHTVVVTEEEEEKFEIKLKKTFLFFGTKTWNLGWKMDKLVKLNKNSGFWNIWDTRNVGGGKCLCHSQKNANEVESETQSKQRQSRGNWECRKCHDNLRNSTIPFTCRPVVSFCSKTSHFTFHCTKLDDKRKKKKVHPFCQQSKYHKTTITTICRENVY